MVGYSNTRGKSSVDHQVVSQGTKFPKRLHLGKQAKPNDCSFNYIAPTSTPSGIDRKHRMERSEKKSEHRKRKRKPENDKSLQLLQHADADTIFSLLLAAIHNSDTPSSLSLIKKCLIKLKPTFLSQNPNPNPILSLLTFLLTSK